jgi:CRISPR-associated protein Cmr5
MNKKRVDDWILKAKWAIEKAQIAKDGKVKSGFRSQISSFGAAMVTGSFKSAVAFFVNDGDSKVARSKLLVAIYYVVVGKPDGDSWQADNVNPNEVLSFVCKNDGKEVKEKFLDAAIAVKLALNFFDLIKECKGNEKSEFAVQ